jgi:hypothetical protein
VVEVVPLEYILLYKMTVMVATTAGNFLIEVAAQKLIASVKQSGDNIRLKPHKTSLLFHVTGVKKLSRTLGI